MTQRPLPTHQGRLHLGLGARLCALGLLLLLNAVAPQAGIVALASCLAHLPATDSDAAV